VGYQNNSGIVGLVSEKVMARNGKKRLLVSDFDGTMTRHDFYRLAIEQWIPRDCPDYWSEYRAGRMTHFQALSGYFKSIQASRDQVEQLMNQMELDPQLSPAISQLTEAGWKVIVASAGCSWYIDRLLESAGVALEVHANPGSFSPETGLEMRMPTASPYLSLELGIDKALIVRHGLLQYDQVAFAGDGFPDAEAARLVPQELRFARGDLAQLLTAEELAFHPFERWAEVADILLANAG
jgi:2-hydroxy-3-keto-5-methylthiopentenyl-1-phosphate phosphatase